MTPEGKVKEKVKQILSEYGVYYFMPVQMGMGPSGLDFHCVLPGGLAFFIETKEEGKEPTLRQLALIKKLDGMNVQCFIIDGDRGYRELRMWLERNSIYSLEIKQARLKI